MTLTRWIPIAALSLASLGLPHAMAHGTAQPQHGGIVQMANDVSFELVADADGLSIYLMDHGTPLPSAGIVGKLTVLQGSRKTELDVKAAGDNRLRATGITVAKGDKIVAVLHHVAGKTTTVRFTVR